MRQLHIVLLNVLGGLQKNYVASVAKSRRAGRPHSVFPAMYLTFGPSLLLLTALKIVCDVMLMLQPQGGRGAIQ